MRSIIRSLATFFAALCLVSSASAIGIVQSAEAPAASAVPESQVVVVTGRKLVMSDVAEVAVLPPIATTENFSLGEWKSLWAYFIAQKRPLHEWEKYWKDASALSGVNHTDRAWRHLSVGVVVTVQRNQSAIFADEIRRDVAQFAAERAALKADLAEMSQMIASLKEANQQGQLQFSLMGLVALSMFALCAFLLLRWRLAERKVRDVRDCELDELKEHRLYDDPIATSGGQRMSGMPSSLSEIEATRPTDVVTPKSCCGENGCASMQCSCDTGKCCGGAGQPASAPWSAPTATTPAGAEKLNFKYFSDDAVVAPANASTATIRPHRSSEPFLLKIVTFSPELELGYAVTQDGAGRRYAFSQKTEGYSADFEAGKTFMGIVNSTGCVVKILPATPT